LSEKNKGEDILEKKNIQRGFGERKGLTEEREQN